MKTWRPNQSGTFSNRTSVYNLKDEKEFVIEFYCDDLAKRQMMVNVIVNAPELLEELDTLCNMLDVLDKSSLSEGTNQRIEKHLLSALDAIRKATGNDKTTGQKMADAFNQGK